MKKSKSDLEAAQAILKEISSENTSGLKIELSKALESVLSETNARSFHYMMTYYGLYDNQGLTLEAIGEKVAGGLTRERVRQIIDHGLGFLLKKEQSSSAMIRPYAKSQQIFEQLLQEKKLSFLCLEDLLSHEFFSDFVNNEKGFISFLNDANIRQVVYRRAHYIYPSRMERKEAIEAIQEHNKKERRKKTVEKMSLMAKTVTYVPLETREELLNLSKEKDIPLNRLYEQILVDFMAKKPYENTEYFSKTQSWKARQGKAKWQQVGIYIDKNIFKQTQTMANAVTPEPVSNMAFICQAFIWFTKECE